jgi:hypothetical protein
MHLTGRKRDPIDRAARGFPGLGSRDNLSYYDVANVMHMCAARSGRCIDIVRADGVEDSAVVRKTYLLQRIGLKLAIDNVHANRWEQAIKFPIATD